MSPQRRTGARLGDSFHANRKCANLHRAVIRAAGPLATDSTAFPRPCTSPVLRGSANPTATGAGRDGVRPLTPALLLRQERGHAAQPTVASGVDEQHQRPGRPGWRLLSRDSAGAPSALLCSRRGTSRPLGLDLLPAESGSPKRGRDRDRVGRHPSADFRRDCRPLTLRDAGLWLSCWRRRGVRGVGWGGGRGWLRAGRGLGACRAERVLRWSGSVRG